MLLGMVFICNLGQLEEAAFPREAGGEEEEGTTGMLIKWDHKTLG